MYNWLWTAIWVYISVAYLNAMIEDMRPWRSLPWSVLFCCRKGYRRWQWIAIASTKYSTAARHSNALLGCINRYKIWEVVLLLGLTLVTSTGKLCPFLGWVFLEEYRSMNHAAQRWAIGIVRNMTSWEWLKELSLSFLERRQGWCEFLHAQNMYSSSKISRKTCNLSCWEQR